MLAVFSVLSVGRRLRPLFALCMLGLGAAGCTRQDGRDVATQFSETRPQEFFQTSVDRMATLSMADNLDSLYLLMNKLYLRNPGEWRKSGFVDAAAAERNVRQAIEQQKP